MNKKLLFNTMAEIYDRLTTAGCTPNDMTVLGCKVQTGGKGDSTFLLGVATGFKSIAGDNWEAFREFYAPTKKLPDAFIYKVTGKLTHFWKKIEPKEYEFKKLAQTYLDWHK